MKELILICSLVKTCSILFLSDFTVTISWVKNFLLIIQFLFISLINWLTFAVWLFQFLCCLSFCYSCRFAWGISFICSCSLIKFLIVRWFHSRFSQAFYQTWVVLIPLLLFLYFELKSHCLNIENYHTLIINKLLKFFNICCHLLIDFRQIVEPFLIFSDYVWWHWYFF